MKNKLVLLFMILITVRISNSLSLVEFFNSIDQNILNIENATTMSSSTDAFFDVNNVNIKSIGSFESAQVNGFALWLRNTPRFLQAGNYRYFAMHDSMKVVLYQRNLIGGGDWVPVWYSPIGETYRNPTLLLDSAKKLHVIYERTTNGSIAHYTFFAADIGLPDKVPVKINTDLLSEHNYYHTAAYDKFTNNIILCAAYFLQPVEVNAQVRCANHSTGEGVWGSFIPTQSYTNHHYLYGLIQPINASQTIITYDAYRFNPAMSFITRVLNMFIYHNKSFVDAEFGGTFGHEVIQKAFISQDITTTESGVSYILAVPAPFDNSPLLENKNRVIKIYPNKSTETSILNINGGKYTFGNTGNNIYIVGSSTISYSANGVWKSVEIPLSSYPIGQYTYGVRQAMQIRSGSDIVEDAVFMQEMVNKTTGKIELVEVEVKNIGSKAVEINNLIMEIKNLLTKLRAIYLL